MDENSCKDASERTIALDPIPLEWDPNARLTIHASKAGGFFVRIGDRYSDSLTQDEALWVASSFLHGKPVRPGWLRTAEEWRTRADRRGIPTVLTTQDGYTVATEVQEGGEYK